MQFNAQPSFHTGRLELITSCFDLLFVAISLRNQSHRMLIRNLLPFRYVIVTPSVISSFRLFAYSYLSCDVPLTLGYIQTQARARTAASIAGAICLVIATCVLLPL